LLVEKGNRLSLEKFTPRRKKKTKKRGGAFTDGSFHEKLNSSRGEKGIEYLERNKLGITENTQRAFHS